MAIRRQATLSDVAALAGVSGKTVSRVVNGDANVSRATREKVDTAIASTGFRLNLAARSLAAARSYLIGTFVAELPAAYYAELYRGAAHACRRLGYHLIVEEFGYSDIQSDHPSLSDDYTHNLATVAYDGLILPPPICDDPMLLDALDDRGLRYVRIAPALDPARSPAVFADEEDGIAAIAVHLWQAGHRRFGVIVGPEGHGATRSRHEQFVAVLMALGAERGAVHAEPITYAADMIECGRAAAERLFARDRSVTAIFAFNDENAAGVVLAARERGLDVPGDLAVAGFDDSDVARLTWPPLTTIRQPIRLMAEAAVELLVNPAEASEQRRLGVELIVRGSTDATQQRRG